MQAAAPENLTESLKSLHDNLQSIQLTYREEVTRIFSQFATRGGPAKREKWDAYTAHLRTLFTREKILAEWGDAFPEPPEASRGAAEGEIFGNEFAPKSVALTFDDGPHPRYTEQVLALLKKYGMRAEFFELGANLGTVEDGDVQLSRNAEIARKVLEAGHQIANHSYSHPVLARLTEERRTSEIERTSLLLEKISGRKPVLFRAPYGARNKQILQQINSEGMRSIMWTIDSQDWADPIPESIAMRVLHQLNETHKGIILFHDIHKQSVIALSPVIEELQRQDYTFLVYDNGKFVKSTEPAGPARSPESAPPGITRVRRHLYRASWALINGVNDYQNWPKLRYAVNDANGIEEALVSRFGFQRSHIRKLLNADATRQHIMEVLGDEFTDGNKIQRDDRIFFFFAGHGATRTMQDGRQIGFIIPVDADRANYYSTAISMTALREACDLIPAKHIYFVMDSCYSGLALMRGAGAFSRDHSYLEEVTRRTARQILTAGGADQQVADDGPNGHSVFTWALLQGLDGKADLDGNGFITASELGAYISPVVSSFSKQTPMVGNLVGSEGGEFVFELQPQLLSSTSQQLDGQGLKLNQQLAALEKQVAAKQEELLRMQLSIQAANLTLRAPAPATSASARAYELDRQARQFYTERNYESALRKLEEAIALKPGDPVLLNNLGYIYFRLGRYSEAITYLQKTIAADPKRKEAYGNIADAYLKLGQRQEAKNNYEQYLALYPATPRAPEVKKLLSTL